jgi:hypothetical protein
MPLDTFTATPAIAVAATTSKGYCRARLIAGGVFTLLAVIVTLVYFSRPSVVVLQENTVWSSDTQPLVISQRVIVSPNVTLTIQPGTTVYFRPRAGVSIHGRLVAEGTPARRIRLMRHPDSARLWAGISFADTQQENRLRYVDIEGAGSEGQYVHIQRSNVILDHAHFSGAENIVVDVVDSSLVLRNSVVEGVGNHEVIHSRRTPVGGHFLVESNTFYPNVGYHDIVDVSDCKSPGAIPRFVGNIFLGGGDDGLDIDRSEAHVEGNIFVNFKRKGHKRDSHAISVGAESRVTVTNNLFAYNEHAILSRKGAHVRLLNSTFYGTRYGAVCFNARQSEPGGATIENCIFWDNNVSLLYDDQAIELLVKNSVLPEAARWSDQGNLNVDPKFEDAPNGNFRLQPDSPALGRGASIDPARFPRVPLNR